jgi:hypothetical protein
MRRHDDGGQFSAFARGGAEQVHKETRRLRNVSMEVGVTTFGRITESDS